MIEVNVLKDYYETKNIYDRYNIGFENNCFCMAATDNDEILGVCLFKYENAGVIIKELQPRNDLLMLDGILRSTLFVASNRKIEKAFYDNIYVEEILKKLDFIDDITAKSLKIKKIFDSCCCCNK